MARVKPRYLNVDGFLLPESFCAEDALSAMRYRPRPDDVFVVTYPKCGTTWMCQIVLLIMTKGEPLTDKISYFSRCPFFEFFGAKAAETMTRPGCIKIHLPFDRINFSTEAKYLYVARHPRDCIISFYHHTKFFPLYRFSEGTLDDFFELFIRGEVDFGDYFDNLLSWYDKRDYPNVFFTTYEDMQADHKGTVLKVAEFLGKEYHSELLENDGEILDKVMKYSSFEYMKKDVNNIFTEAFLNPEESVFPKLYNCMKTAVEAGHNSVGSFIRKGKVGEGKEALSEEQLERLNARILEKTEGSDVMSLWS